MSFNKQCNSYLKRCDMVLDLYRKLAALNQKVKQLKYITLYNDIEDILQQTSDLNKTELEEFAVIMQHRQKHG